jgi:hypothetical protein
MLAGHVVIFRHTAAELVRQSLAHEVPGQFACRLRRNAAEMMRAAAQAERSLGRRPVRAVPTYCAPATDGFDLAALDVFWCGDRVTRPGPGPLPGAADEAPDAWGNGTTCVVPAWARQPGWRC